MYKPVGKQTPKQVNRTGHLEFMTQFAETSIGAFALDTVLLNKLQRPAVGQSLRSARGVLCSVSWLKKDFLCKLIAV